MSTNLIDAKALFARKLDEAARARARREVVARVRALVLPVAVTPPVPELI